jgi:hypothetical protein
VLSTDLVLDKDQVQALQAPPITSNSTRRRCCARPSRFIDGLARAVQGGIFAPNEARNFEGLERAVWELPDGLFATIPARHRLTGAIA